MAGRPSKITNEVLAKLDEAFLNGHTDEEACLIAEIDPSTFYRYIEKHPNYASRKELLKRNVTIAARKNIVKKIQEGNVELSKWWMERKAKEEFNPKEDIEAIIREEKSKWDSARKMDDMSDYIKAVLESKPPGYIELKQQKTIS